MAKFTLKILRVKIRGEIFWSTCFRTAVRGRRTYDELRVPKIRVRSLCCGSSGRPVWASWPTTGGFMNDDVSTTSWLWALHADAHDFPRQVGVNGLVASRIFATHFGHLSMDPLNVKPSAQIIYAGANHLQDVINGDLGASTSGIRVTSGVFSVWRGMGITS